eukprot:UN16233
MGPKMVSYAFLLFEISQDITMDIEAEEHDTNFITPEKKQYEDDIEEEEEEVGITQTQEETDFMTPEQKDDMEEEEE